MKYIWIILCMLLLAACIGLRNISEITDIDTNRSAFRLPVSRNLSGTWSEGEITGSRTTNSDGPCINISLA